MGDITELLERDDLGGADEERGRFRSYLLSRFVHFSANEWNRMRAEKRGGGHAPLSLDDRWAEDRLSSEPATEEDPESLYQRAWAHALLEEVMQELPMEFAVEAQKLLAISLEGSVG